MKAHTSLLIVALALGSLSTPLRGEEFPLRKKYPDLTPISTRDLTALGDNVVIIDVRNKAEFDVIHVDTATNLVLSKLRKGDLEALRPATGSRPMVFYCNGHTCSKSYKATTKAKAWGFENIFVYDSGIFEWAQTNPQRSLFFDAPLDASTVKSKLIPRSELAKVSLPPAEFIERATSGEYVVFDLRDQQDRAKFNVKLEGIRKASIDKFIHFLEKTRAVPQSKILMLDNVGKQVKWVHYYLKRAGRTDFYFLGGGVRAWKEAGFDAHGKN